MLHGFTPLHVFESDNVTSVRYRGVIMEPYVDIFKSPDFILIDGNARPYIVFIIISFAISYALEKLKKFPFLIHFIWVT